MLNGSREGLFFAALTAARYVGERKGKPAILMPNPFYPAYGAGRARRGLRADLSADHVGDRFTAQHQCPQQRDAGRTRRDLPLVAGESARRRGLHGNISGR